MRSAEPLHSPPAEPCWNNRLTPALWALEDGIEPDALTEKLTKLYGRDRGRRIVDMASVRLWLAEGVRPGDAMTMLDSRRRLELSASECRAYAIEILLNVRQAVGSEDGPLASSRNESCRLERTIAPTFRADAPLNRSAFPTLSTRLPGSIRDLFQPQRSSLCHCLRLLRPDTMCPQ